MLDILAITSPIYITILTGFLATRYGWFDKPAMRNFGAFVIKLALPALLFRAVGQRQIGEILNVSYLAAYAGGSLAVIGVAYFCCRRFARLGRSTSAIYAMGMSCSNSGFIGYPILLLTFAPVAGVALALNVIIENVLVLPLLLAMAERGGGDSGPWYKLAGKSLAQLARNPIVIGTAAGLVVSLFGWTLPAPADRTVSMFAVSSAALSLFVIGGTLVGLPIGRLAKRAAPVSFFKLVGHPLAVLAGVLAVPFLGLPRLEPMLGMAAVLLAAVPMASIYPILAQAYGQEDFSATALVITIIASFFTLSGLLWIMHRVSM
ncbi:AEC family transporter [Massilia sp. R2A-15]|uniref:AEC family transporter n=1 Tax=Massilia sp. R2A-15 TaxID=3064278 RepID=UPI002732ED54|nr:AEC family transporter [Massilia sp. R2A-15]WLI90757.1 AEC family transporter [Massilia sp. R2A-15]